MTDLRRHFRVVLVAAGTAALIVGGGVLTSQQGSKSTGHARPVEVRGQRVDVTSDDCDAIHQQLEKKQKVDDSDALQCDQQEFAELEQKRLNSQTPLHVQLSVTCALINNRLADGDVTVPEDLATNCRNRELFAIKTDAANKLGSANKPTALCLGKRHLDDDEKTAPDFWDEACGRQPFGTQPLQVSETADPANSPEPELGSPVDGPPPQAGTIRQCDVTSIAGKFEKGGPGVPLSLAGSTLFPIGSRVRVDNPATGSFVYATITEDADIGCLALAAALRRTLASPPGGPAANTPPRWRTCRSPCSAPHELFVFDRRPRIFWPINAAAGVLEMAFPSARPHDGTVKPVGPVPSMTADTIRTGPSLAYPSAGQGSVTTPGGATGEFAEGDVAWVARSIACG